MRNVLLGLVIIFLFYMAGEFIHTYFQVPFPGNLIGMLLLFIALVVGVVKVEWVEQTAQFFLRHMLVFFAPLIVGVIVFVPLFAENVAGVILTFVLSTVTVLIVTGWLMQYWHGKGVTQNGNE